MSSASDPAPRIHVSGLTMAYGSYVIQRDLDFVIRRGEVFVIMGGSGSGKSTLLNRAGVARAMALDPDILFFDEPSAGLDPISSRRLDDLILELRDSLGATMVVVTHELPSIFTIADNAVFLDAETRTMIAYGNPKTLRDESPNPTVRTFLKRGAVDAAAGGAAV